MSTVEKLSCKNSAFTTTPSDLLFRDFAFNVYLPFVRPRKRSWRTDESLIRNHLIPALGSRQLADVEVLDIFALQSDLLRRGYKVGSINRITVLLKYMINSARRWRLIERELDWAADAPEMRDAQARERFLDQAQAKRLISTCMQDSQRTACNLILALLFTGARKSELLFAKWCQVDFQSKTLQIPLSKSGKTRYIYLSEESIQVLSRQRSDSGNVYIFSEPDHTRPISTLTKVWQRIREQCGFEDFRLHDLRHSFASFAIANGVSIYEVQKLLGHADTKTTMKYAHLAGKQLIAASCILPGVLGHREARI